MKNIALYRTVFPVVSETFIEEQARSMKRYSPVVISRRCLRNTSLRQISLDRLSSGKIRGLYFALTANPNCYGEHLRRERVALMHAHFGPDAVYALSLSRHLSIPLFVTFHGFDSTMSRKELILTKRYSNWRYILNEPEIASYSHRIIAVSNYVRDRLIARGYPAEKVVKHYIGVDVEKFHPVKNCSSDMYILSVGRHVEVKGIDTLLIAFSKVAPKYPGVRLIQVGSGVLTEKLRRLAISLGIADRVTFAGACAADDVRRLMQRCKLFVLPSQTVGENIQEALGIVFNEASACGIPIVSTWNGGIPEAVIHGETGILVRERDPGALADAMGCILADQGLAALMGKRGRELVCDSFNISKQTAALERMYDEVIK